MKKKNLKSLKLNKKSISKLKGGQIFYIETIFCPTIPDPTYFCYTNFPAICTGSLNLTCQDVPICRM